MSKLEMPILNLVYVELKQINAFCAGAISCSKDREFKEVIQSINKNIVHILEAIIGNVDAVVKKEVQKKDILPKDVSVDDLYLGSRLRHSILMELRNRREHEGLDVEAYTYTLQDVLDLNLLEWLKVPSIGIKSLSELYWKCYKIGFKLDTSKLSYQNKKFINAMEGRFND